MYFIAKQSFDNTEWELHERCSSYIEAKEILKKHKDIDIINKVIDIRPWCILDICGEKILVLK